MERLEGFRQELNTSVGRLMMPIPGSWPGTGGLSSPERIAISAPTALEDTVIKAVPNLRRISEIVKLMYEVGRRRMLIENSVAYKNARIKLGFDRG